MAGKQKLELTWIGKEKRPRLEPRILLEVPEKSYHAKARHSENDIYDNMLIHGDNLLALKALEQEYAGKVKCIYIDPPYNTGNAFEHYDDGLEHSIWLGLMRDRLELIHHLLSNDGSLWINLDDNEVHYCKVMCDEIFGRPNFLATFIWEKRTTRENRRVYSFRHDYILMYARNKSEFEAARNPLPLNDSVLERYKNPDNDPRGVWQSISALAQAGHATASQFYTLTTPSGKKIDPPAGNCWRYTENKMQEEIKAGRIWFGKSGNNVPRIKRYLAENPDDGLTPETILFSKDAGTNDSAKKHLLMLFSENDVFDTPKPEELLKQIIHIASNPGDLVLDSFLGSGTTAAVAHKMGRRWIGIELGDHCYTHCLPRLQKVVDGEDKGGITEAVNWPGGGGFRFYELGGSLIKTDQWGNEVINPEFNAGMLTQAMCKIEGFTYAPSEEEYFIHGHGSERYFIYVTTNYLSQPMLEAISESVGPDRNLLICCSSFKADLSAFANLTVKKIPKAILDKCEWGHDDYSLEIKNLPMAQPEPAVAKGKRSKVNPDQPELFGGNE